MELTRREFFERCFNAINTESFVSQLALLVELYWSAKGRQERWPLFKMACQTCGTTHDAIALIALKGHFRNHNKP